MKAPLDTCLVSATKRYFVAKNMQKLIEKINTHYKEGKIDEAQLKTKIGRLRELIATATSTLQKHGAEIEEKKKEAPLHYFVLEHLNYNHFKNTAVLYAEKIGIKNNADLEFYEDIREMCKSIVDGEYGKSIAFCKEYKIYNKTLFSEIESKLRVLEFKKISGIDKAAAIEYCRVAFKKEKGTIKNYLHSLVDRVENVGHSSLANEFEQAILKLYNIDDRFTSRIYYGLIAFKTVFCRKNGLVECPGCNFTDFTEIVNRIENSEIVCEGSGIVLDSGNQAYADANGRVYGIEYLNDAKKSIDDPKICYFV